MQRASARRYEWGCMVSSTSKALLLMNLVAVAALGMSPGAGEDASDAGAGKGEVPAPIDEERFLFLMGGDEQLVRRISELFLESCPVRLREVEEALMSGDAEGARYAAHGLKGSAANIAAERARRLAEELERAAREGRLEAALPTLEELKDELRRVEEYLRERIGDNPA